MDSFPNVAIQDYATVRKQLKSGDILLCSGTALFSALIQQATHSVWSHVAFVIYLEVIDRVMVLESVESIGVRSVPLSSYVSNYNGTGKGYPGRIMLARPREFQPENILSLSKEAVDLLGYPYDKDEILRIAARVSMQNLAQVAPPDPAPERAFICSEYAYLCYKSVGVNIPYDPLGFIAPADFARCPEVDPVAFIKTL